MKNICAADVRGKRVLLRLDLDVSVEGEKVVDDFRLRAALPTLSYLVEKQAQSVTLVGHRGRPAGLESELTLKPVIHHLERLLGLRIEFVDGRVIEWLESGKTHVFPAGLRDRQFGRLTAWENLRFGRGEQKNSVGFAQRLASLHDLYVNEAFAVSHRVHASVVGVTRFLPSYAGIHLAEEVRRLKAVYGNPRRPLIFVIGGGKTDKVKYVEAFSKYADEILVGGVLMFEQGLEDLPKVYFPVDSVGHGDIGPRSVKLFKQHLARAQTVVWNGPLGKFEEEKYLGGTREIARELARRATLREVEVVVGGGDTLAALKKLSLRDKMSFVSVGGGSMLELLSRGSLPGLEALED